MVSLMRLAVQSKQRMLFVELLKNEWSAQHGFEHVAQRHVEVVQQEWHTLGTSSTDCVNAVQGSVTFCSCSEEPKLRFVKLHGAAA